MSLLLHELLAHLSGDLLHTADPKRLSGMIEDALNGSSVAPASPRSIGRRDSGQKPLLVPDSTREKVRERILAALKRNVHLSSSKHDLAQIAADCEGTCYSSSKSKYAPLLPSACAWAKHCRPLRRYACLKPLRRHDVHLQGLMARQCT